MLNPIEIQDMIAHKAVVFEEEGINSIDYWSARCGVDTETLLEWCQMEFLHTVTTMAECKDFIELINVICISSFLQGMIYGTQLNDLELEEIEI